MVTRVWFLLMLGTTCCISNITAFLPQASPQRVYAVTGQVATATTLQAIGNKRSVDKGAEDTDDEFDEFSLEAFNKARSKIEAASASVQDDFDGYMLRDIIEAKWGGSHDVDFNRVDAFGIRKLYLNVMPFKLGRRPFRHASELEYLCHLQAVVEILQKYKQLDYVLVQIQETNKKPIAGRVPVVAVPLRLDLTAEQVEKIIGD